MNISIKRLTADDWRVFSEIRLKALQTDPAVFGSNYDAESKFKESDWRNWLDRDTTAIFMIFEGEAPVGITSISVDRNDPTNRTAIMWGSWIEPHLRGKGVSAGMYESRINWAKSHPTIERIIVSHRASNHSSKFANQKHGFLLTGESERTWPDGVRETEFHYVLELPDQR